MKASYPEAVMTKPSGTGRPRLVRMSARLAIFAAGEVRGVAVDL